MRGPIFANAPEGRRDRVVHETILRAINFTKSKAMKGAVRRAEALGLDPKTVKNILGT